MLLIVLFNIAKRRFIRNRADGTRAEGMPRPENHLRVLMRLALVLAGEIQVDIRFLVPGKDIPGATGQVRAGYSKLRRNPAKHLL